MCTWDFDYREIDEMEEDTNVVGCACTLLNDYRGYTDGVILRDFGNELIILLTCGKEVMESRDEVLIML